jgi:hypothetical protein
MFPADKSGFGNQKRVLSPRTLTFVASDVTGVSQSDLGTEIPGAILTPGRVPSGNPVTDHWHRFRMGLR